MFSYLKKIHFKFYLKFILEINYYSFILRIFLCRQLCFNISDSIYVSFIECFNLFQKNKTKILIILRIFLKTK